MNIQSQLAEAEWSLDATTQDRDQWKSKFLKAQQDLMRADNERTHHVRDMANMRSDLGTLREELSTRTKQLSTANAQIETLSAELKGEKKQYTAMYDNLKDTMAKVKGNAGSGAGPTDAELDLQDEILESLREDNRRLLAIQHTDVSCQQKCTRMWDDMQDLQDAKDIAEAEMEGLRHMETQNEVLFVQHNADSLCLAALRQENSDLEVKLEQAHQRAKIEAKLAQAREGPRQSIPVQTVFQGTQQSLEDELGGLLNDGTSSVYSPYPPVKDQTSSVYSPYPPLSLAGTPPRFYSSPTKQPASKHSSQYPPLSSDDSPLPVLVLQVTNPNAASLSVSPPAAAPPAKNSSPPVKDSSPPVKHSKTKLALSSISAISSSPVPHAQPARHSTTPAIKIPRFTLGLIPPHRPLPSITEETPSPTSPIPSPSELAFTTFRPHVALTITIKSNDNKALALLIRVRGAISKTSTLNVTGPTDTVSAFVRQMENVERFQSRSLARWQGEAMALKGQNRELRRELYLLPLCRVVEHQGLVEELVKARAEGRGREGGRGVEGGVAVGW